jgi:hypothetical protein
MKRKLLAVLVVPLLLLGCGKNYKAHPGAVDNFDSKTYDTLLIAQAGLDDAKQQVAIGKLPPSAKDVINGAGNAYNLLRDAWNGYRAVKTANPTDPAQEYVAKINALLPQVNQFIDDLTRLLGHKPKVQAFQPVTVWGGL